MTPTAWRSLVPLLAAALLLPTSLGADPAAPARDAMDPALAAALAAAAAGAEVGVIVTFDDEAALEAFLPSVVGTAGIRYQTVPALAFHASAADVAQLPHRPGVRYVQLDELQPVLLPTATVASAARAVWGTLDGGPMLHPVTGEPIDGTGVGVAVVDTGIMGAHPDLAPGLVKNFKVIGTSGVPMAGSADILVDMPHTDTTSGHGTHVAGIVAGTGVSSGGQATGAAPGASLYGFGAGEGALIVVSFAAAAFDWIAQNHATANPPIRVVTNSWGGTGAYSPLDVINALTTELVQRGIVVVWAAGNGDTFGDGGTGADDRVNRYAKNPAPGVLGVANYDDAETGTRDGILASSSSRGHAATPSTWPDLSAPGTNIYSAMDATGGLSWLSKGIDAFSGGFEPGNPFGNAINQHAGTVAFRLGGTTSAAARLDWIIWTSPVVAYNAHRDAFAAGVGTVPDSAEAQQMRFYGPVPPGTPGPIAPTSQSGAAVAPGDVLLLTKGNVGGTGNPIKVQVTSPAGTSKTLTVHFPCRENCGVPVDLAAAFGGDPRDGTWIVAPGPTVATGRLEETLSPWYVQMTGTSMAAPHVAGVVALMLQADPSLTPAQVEDILGDTAYKFTFGAPYGTDPANADNTSSFDKGHGLVDAKAAVLAALS